MWEVFSLNSIRKKCLQRSSTIFSLQPDNSFCVNRLLVAALQTTLTLEGRDFPPGTPQSCWCRFSPRHRTTGRAAERREPGPSRCPASWTRMEKETVRAAGIEGDLTAGGKEWKTNRIRKRLVFVDRTCQSSHISFNTS